MSDNDELTSLVEAMLRLAESMAGGHSPGQAGAAASKSRPDELIDGKEKLTYILNAPGYEKDQLRVSVLPDSLEVKGPDFLVRRELPHSADPDTARSKYLNGVLSVTVAKKP